MVSFPEAFESPLVVWLAVHLGHVLGEDLVVVQLRVAIVPLARVDLPLWLCFLDIGLGGLGTARSIVFVVTSRKYLSTLVHSVAKIMKTVMVLADDIEAELLFVALALAETLSGAST